jgi:KDO2-lipid IV(A) lauroyltransferase
LALRHAVEFRALQGVLFALDRLQMGRAESLARALGRSWFRVDPRRLRVAVANVLRAGFAEDAAEARQLAYKSAEHFALVVVESLRSADILGDAPRQSESIELALHPTVLAALEDPDRPLIISSGHFGNWEIAAQLLSRWKPVAGITRPMNNPRVEELVQQRKPRYRFHPIPKYGIEPKRFLDVLRRGEILALLTDQHARSGGVPIPLFGHPVSTYTTPAMLHLVAKAPLCFAACRRVGPMRFRVESSPLIERRRSGDRAADVRWILEQLNGYLEEAVRDAPEQYLWGHRFWR